MPAFRRLRPRVPPLLPLLLLLLHAAPAAASPTWANLDPAQSAHSGGFGATALNGSVRVDLGASAPSGNRPFDIVDLAVAGGGLFVSLQSGLANPGLGVLRADGSFLIPALFVRVAGAGLPDPLSLTLRDVMGSFGLSAACSGDDRCLESSFQIDTLGPSGLLDVAITAQVPEPGTGLLMTLGCVGLAALRGREGGR
jgi:hypothetical protein